MSRFKAFKTYIRKKIGMVGVAEFVDDPVQGNSKNSWNSWFGNEKFLKEYTDPKRIESYNDIIDAVSEFKVFDSANSVFDMGCGTGHLLLAINKRFPNIKLFGSDFSEEAVSFSQKLLPSAEFFTLDIYNIPESFYKKYDVVICSEVLEHLLYPEKALNNIFNLLPQNGGTIVLAVPNGRIDTYSGHINFWSPESWKVFVENNLKNGFKANFKMFSSNRNNLAIISNKGIL